MASLARPAWRLPTRVPDALVRAAQHAQHHPVLQSLASRCRGRGGIQWHGAGRVLSLLVFLYVACITFHRAYELVEFDPREAGVELPDQSYMVFYWYLMGSTLVALRCLSRLVVRRVYVCEDLLFCAGLGLACTIGALYWGLLEMLEVGLTTRLTYSAAARYAEQIQLTEEILPIFASLAFKACLLLHYNRLFAPRPPRLVTAAMLALVTLQALASAAVYLAQCAELSTMWELNEPGLCMSNAALGWLALAPEACTTALVLLVPLFYLTRINWTPLKLVGAFLMLGYGWFAVFVVALQITVTVHLVEFGPRGIAEAAVLSCGNYFILTSITNLLPLFSKAARRSARFGGTGYIRKDVEMPWAAPEEQWWDSGSEDLPDLTRTTTSTSSQSCDSSLFKEPHAFSREPRCAPSPLASSFSCEEEEQNIELMEVDKGCVATE